MIFGMSILGLLGTAGTWVLGRFTSWGLGAIVPVLTGIGNLMGAVISAIASIIAALAQSPEGRVVLAACAAALCFLYLRFHYIEEGKAAGISSVKPQIVRVMEKCPNPPPVKVKAKAPQYSKAAVKRQ